MAGETTITVVGNLTADPELRYTQSGVPVVNFTVASTPRAFDKNSGEWKDGEALFLRCSLWRSYAENVAGSLTKGMRVIVQGNLKQRNYETREGERRSSFELDVVEIGPALRYATAEITRTTQMSAGPTQSTFPQPHAAAPTDAAQSTQDAWATPGMFSEDSPF